MQFTTTFLFIAPILAGAALAQEKVSPTYRLNFQLRDSPSETKQTVRNYSVIVQSRSRAKINASRRLPYYTSSKNEAKEVHAAAIGSIIECTPDERDAGVVLNCAFESSHVAAAQPTKQPPVGLLPVVNSRQVSTTARIPFGVQVQIATLDDPSNATRTEIFVTVERLN
jgi:hypothetical protein